MCETALLQGDYEATHAAETHVQVMIANHAGLFFVTEDRAVLGPLGFWAVGSGRDFALGALKVGPAPGSGARSRYVQGRDGSSPDGAQLRVWRRLRDLGTDAQGKTGSKTQLAK